MALNCLEGYLTPACASCPDWADGTNPKRGVGCACHFPIMQCPHFRKACEEEEKKYYKEHENDGSRIQNS